MATLQRKKKFLVWGNGHTQRTFWREETALLQPCDCSRIRQPDASWALRLRTGDTGVGAASARRRTWQRRAPGGPGLSPAVLPASSHPLTPMPDPSGSPDGPAFEAHLSPTRSSHLPAAGLDPKFCGASNTGDTSSPSEVAGGRTAGWGTVPPRRHPETRCGAVPQVQPEAPGGARARPRRGRVGGGSLQGHLRSRPAAGRRRRPRLPARGGECSCGGAEGSGQIPSRGAARPLCRALGATRTSVTSFRSLLKDRLLGDNLQSLSSTTPGPVTTSLSPGLPGGP